jgi:hypothetical protein
VLALPVPDLPPVAMLAEGAGVVGFLGLLAALLGLALAAQSLADSLRLRRTRSLTVTACADAGGTGRATVAVRGWIGPGPLRVVTAPLSGQPCVWWRIQVDRMEPSDGGEVRRGHVDHHLAAPFALVDGTGAVLVDGPVAEDLPAGGPLLAVTRSGTGTVLGDRERLLTLGLVDERFADGRGGAWLRAREVILPAGAAATVVAQPRHGPGGTVLVRRPGRLAFARPEPLDEIVTATRGDRDDRLLAAVVALAFGLGAAAVGFGLALTTSLPG